MRAIERIQDSGQVGVSGEMQSEPIAAHIWQAALCELQLQMTKATFDTWVKPTFALGFDSDTHKLTVAVRNAYAKQWLENRLYGMIERTMNHVVGKPCEVVFVLRNMPEELLPPPSANVTVPVEEEKAEPPETKRKRDDATGTKPARLKGEYIDPRAEIIKPDRGHFETWYFRTRWAARLGPILARTVTDLRQRCFWNKRTGEKRDEVECTLEDVAHAIGVKYSTLRHEINTTMCVMCERPHPIHEHFFVRRTVRAYDPAHGRVVNKGSHFHVRLDEPLLPDDEQMLVAMMQSAKREHESK